MAERSASVPQSLDESAVADLVRQLNVVGTMGLLNVSDTIVPVYLVEQRRAFSFPIFGQAGMYTNGKVLGSPAFTTLASTPALETGGYDLSFQLSTEDPAGQLFSIELDASPGRTLQVMVNGFENVVFGYDAREGDSWNVLNERAISLTEWAQATIMVAARTS